jgi:hypothetical protein
VTTELPYVVLNREVNRRWNWEGGRGEAGAADGLAHALVTSRGCARWSPTASTTW